MKYYEKYYSMISLNNQRIQPCHEHLKQWSRPLLPNKDLECHRDGSGVYEGANCMQALLQ